MEELEPRAQLPDDVAVAAQDPARRFGPFVIVRELGRGAVGVVHLAWDMRLQRRVALKTLIEMSPEQYLRFAREARAAAQLEHPSIVRVLDLAQVGTRPYIAMEVVEGRSLRAAFKAGDVRTRGLVSVVRDVASALGHAHELGIIHRDVKPANIIIDVHGRGRITDFGLARDATATQEQLTATGTALGTPEYMSPEQASDPRNVGPWSDVYSLGVVLFEGLTGRVPFAGGSAVQIMFKVLSGEVERPSALAEVPPALEKIILRALDHDATRRYPDGNALAAELSAFLVGIEKKTAAPAPRKKKRWIALGVGAAVPIAATLAAWGVVSFREHRRHEIETASQTASRALHEEKFEEARAAIARMKSLGADAAKLEDAVKRAVAKADRKARYDKLLAEAAATPSPDTRLRKLDEAVALDPGRAQAWLERASSKLSQLREARVFRGEEVDPASARIDVERALELEPRSGRAHWLAARVARFANDRAVEERALERVLEVEPAGEFAAIAKVELAFLRRLPATNLRDFLALAKACTEKAPQLPDGWYWLALAANLSRDQPLAESAATKALERREEPEMRRFRGFARLARNDVLAAEEDATAWLRVQPRSPDALFLSAYCKVRRDAWREAFEVGETLAAVDPATGNLVRALSLEGQGELDLAYDAIRAALATATTEQRRDRLFTIAIVGARLHADARMDLLSANDLLVGTEARLGQMPEVTGQRCEIALRRHDLPLLRAQVAALGRAPRAKGYGCDLARLESSFRAACEPFTRALALDPANAAALLARAGIAIDHGEHELARADLEKLAIFPPAIQARACRERARSLGWTGGAEALRLQCAELERALGLDPTFARARAELGAVRASLGLAGALQAVDQAAHEAPRDAFVLAARAEVLVGANRIPEALADADTAVALEPRNRFAREVRLQVHEAKDDRTGMAGDLRALAQLETEAANVSAYIRRAERLERR